MEHHLPHYENDGESLMSSNIQKKSGNMNITSLNPQVVSDEIKLSILYEEYRARDEYRRDLFRMIYQVAGFAIILFSGIATLVFSKDLFSNNSEILLPELVSWIIPLTFVIPYAMVIQSCWLLMFNDFYVRDIERAISKITQIDIFHYQDINTRALYSTRTGSRNFLLTQALIFGAAAGIYLAMVGLSYLNLAKIGTPPERIIMFAVAQGLIIIVILWAVVASFFKPHSLYNSWKTKVLSGKLFSIPKDSTLLMMRYAIIPRIFDLVFKSTVFLAAFAFLCFYYRVSAFSSVIVPVLVTLICIELLAKQTTFIWNDIRDIEDDAKHQHKKKRPLVDHPV
jgi:hypothetical protein